MCVSSIAAVVLLFLWCVSFLFTVPKTIFFPKIFVIARFWSLTKTFFVLFILCSYCCRWGVLVKELKLTELTAPNRAVVFAINLQALTPPNTCTHTRAFTPADVHPPFAPVRAHDRVFAPSFAPSFIPTFTPRARSRSRVCPIVRTHVHTQVHPPRARPRLRVRPLVRTHIHSHVHHHVQK